MARGRKPNKDEAGGSDGVPEIAGPVETPIETAGEIGPNGEDAFAPAVAALDRAAEDFSPVAETLSGDLRDHLLDRLRNMPKLWQQMKEHEQRDYAHAVNDFCCTLIKRAVKLIEADERVTIEVNLDEVAFKPKGIVAKLGLYAIDPDIRHALVDAQGKPILIVVADATKYLGEQAPARIDKQQPDLPLADPGGSKIDADLDAIIAGEQGEPGTASPEMPLGDPGANAGLTADEGDAEMPKSGRRRRQIDGADGQPEA